jgi:hypothetical protein
MAKKGIPRGRGKQNKGKTRKPSGNKKIRKR